MTPPSFITFTGFDNNSDIGEMKALAKDFPIEWGMLLSPSRQGVDPRFPGGEAQSRLLWSGLRLSAHLCGKFSDVVVKGRDIPPLEMPVDLGCFERIQVNHSHPAPKEIGKYVRGWGKIRGIAQCRGEFPSDTSVDWLFDPSGGRGEEPIDWPQHPGHLVGYAGGINPENVRQIITKINAIGPYWIDMETGVRTENRFDLVKCARVCMAVYE